MIYAFKKIFFWFFILISGTFIYAYFETNTPVLEEVTIEIANLPADLEGFTILQISDLHSTFFGKDQEKITSLLVDKRYDLIALTGDLLDIRNPDPRPCLSLIDKLNNNKPIIFVPGNHERRNYIYNEFRAQLIDKSVKVIDKPEVFYIKKNNYFLPVMGLRYPYSGKDLKELFEVSKKISGPKILLTHAPVIFLDAAHEQIDLILTGHTHGGQICLPFIGAIFTPGERWFPTYDSGYFVKGKTNLYISRGLGTSVIPFRFLSPPEITLITLSSSKKL